MPCHTLPLVVNRCSKHSEPLGTPSKLIQILGDGNCLFRAVSYAVTGRQIYYTWGRAQIVNHMNSSFKLDHYFINCQLARNKVWVRHRNIKCRFSLIHWNFCLHPIWVTFEVGRVLFWCFGNTPWFDTTLRIYSKQQTWCEKPIIQQKQKGRIVASLNDTTLTKVKIWKIRHSGPGWSGVWNLLVV